MGKQVIDNRVIDDQDLVRDEVKDNVAIKALRSEPKSSKAKKISDVKKTLKKTIKNVVKKIKKETSKPKSKKTV